VDEFARRGLHHPALSGADEEGTVIRVTMLFWEESEEQQRAVGRFVLRDRKVEIEALTPDGHGILSRILKRALRTDDTGGHRIRVEENPERWVRLLPMNYDGAQVRAELEES
jgi:hypothetical protein